MTEHDVAITSRGSYQKVETVKGPDGDVSVDVTKYALKVKLNGAIVKCFTKRDPLDHQGASITVFDKGDAVPWEDGAKFDSQFIMVDGYNDAATFRGAVEYETERDALLAE